MRFIATRCRNASRSEARAKTRRDTVRCRFEPKHHRNGRPTRTIACGNLEELQGNMLDDWVAIINLDYMRMCVQKIE